VGIAAYDEAHSAVSEAYTATGGLIEEARTERRQASSAFVDASAQRRVKGNGHREQHKDATASSAT
jgi:hypothetical protein